MKDFILATTGTLSVFSFVVGMIAGTLPEITSDNPMWDCKPNSYFSYVNLPLRAGCEIMKPRCWNDNADHCRIPRKDK